MEPFVLTKEMIVSCQNCVHPAHCDRVCKQEIIGGDSFPIIINCCKKCRCKACSKDEN